jgi:hypothetical protein
VLGGGWDVENEGNSTPTPRPRPVGDGVAESGIVIGIDRGSDRMIGVRTDTDTDRPIPERFGLLLIILVVIWEL